jgi:acyl-CoA thioesterase-1
MSRLRIIPVLAVIVCCACSRSHDATHDATEDSRSHPPAAREAAPETGPPNATASPDSRKVLAVFGDSLAAGYGLPNGRSFPDDLQKRLDATGYAWHVVNLGISGDTTEEGVARIDSAISLKPSIVMVELGGNDGLRGMPLASSRQNLDQMIAAFQKAGAQVVLAGMTLPPNYGPDYIAGFEKMYKDLAAKYRVTLIPFLLADIVTKDLRYFQPDGIHPTAPGAEIVAGTVMRAVEPMLGKPGQR